ncbi:MAG TPA: phosphocholine cytidylyltransferase family protein [Candidatus Acidoferrum sp.]|nr:phosphocholine cytidylyltransferase family protein [Candidatus Acidoferrum sp.]
MKAIILAAGVGKRLWTITQHRPKCLIELGGRTLLARYLDELAGVGIKQAVIVVGHKQEMIQAEVGSGLFGVDVSFLVNEQYRRGSITSLWLARMALDDDAVIMDADVLFHREILRRLISSPSPNALLMDETVQQQTEECMVVVQGGRVIALTKQMPERYDLAGEGVGFMKVAHRDAGGLVESLKTHMDRDERDMEYEDGLREFFSRTRVGFERIGGLPWVEIDFPEDVARAEREILPRLE